MIILWKILRKVSSITKYFKHSSILSVLHIRKFVFETEILDSCKSYKCIYLYKSAPYLSEGSTVQSTLACEKILATLHCRNNYCQGLLNQTQHDEVEDGSSQISQTVARHYTCSKAHARFLNYRSPQFNRISVHF